MLKNFVKVFVLTVLFVTAVQSQTSAEEWIDCAFVNNSGKTITELYFVASSENDLGQNLLPDSMPTGYEFTARYISGFEYDVMIVFSDGNYISYSDQYLSGETQFLIEYDSDYGQIRIKNFGQD